MQIRLANPNDLPHIMDIIHEAQAYLAHKKVDQWQNGYPSQNIMQQDIDNLESFIIHDKDEIVATTMFTTNKEPTYQNIEGHWLSDDKAFYGVIHRMAVSNSVRKKGVAQFIFNYFEELLQKEKVTSMRIDTHEDNQDMQRLLNKLNYTYCGVIYLENGDKRLAFEKIL